MENNGKNLSAAALDIVKVLRHNPGLSDDIAVLAVTQRVMALLDARRDEPVIPVSDCQPVFEYLGRAGDVVAGTN